MRVLHLISSHHWSGAVEPATDLAVYQGRLGHEVCVACVESGGLGERLRDRGISLESGFDLRSGPRLDFTLSDMRRLRQITAARSIDVVHCHLTHDHWMAAFALRGLRGSDRQGGPALVRTLHRDEPVGRDPIHRWLFGAATDMVIAVSRSNRTLTIDRAKMDSDRVAWVHGAVDLERFRPEIDRGINRKLWSLQADTPVAGIVARMRHGRGHREFIDTVEDVVREVPRATYLVTGRGEMEKKIERRIQSHPLRSHLIDAGYRHNDLPETYAAMDLDVILAKGSDGGCRAMLEAMATGRPVIGVDVGAISDAIDPGETGWLIDPRKMREGLTRALIEGLGALKRTAEMGRAARRKIEAEYTQEARAKATIAVYEEALRRKASRAR